MRRNPQIRLRLRRPRTKRFLHRLRLLNNRHHLLKRPNNSSRKPVPHSSSDNSILTLHHQIAKFLWHASRPTTRHANRPPTVPFVPKLPAILHLPPPLFTPPSSISK